MIRKFFASVHADDQAVSPVVGTILMVAATVVLGATIFAAVNAFGGESIEPPVNAVFKVQAVDTDGNGRTDMIKLTYVTGPADVRAADVSIQNSTGAPSGGSHAVADMWSPGDYLLWNPAITTPTSYFYTVSILGTTALDQSIRLDE